MSTAIWFQICCCASSSVRAPGCPEEAAFRQGFVSLAELEKIVSVMPNCEYRHYLQTEVVDEAKRLLLLKPSS